MINTPISAIDATESALAFTIERAPLLAALDFLARRIIERRNSIPIVSTVLIEASPDGLARFTGTDLDMQASIDVRAAVDMPGRKCVDVVTLRDTVKKASGFDVRLSYDATKERFEVASGRNRATLRALPADDFPIVKAPADPMTFGIAAGQLASDWSRVSAAVSTEETRYYLNGILCHDDGEGLAFVATDGHRMLRARRPLPDAAAGISGIIPRKAIAAMLAGLKAFDATERVAVRFGATAASFAFAGDSSSIMGVTVTTKLIDGTFPDYARIVPTASEAFPFPHTLSAECNDLDAAARPVISAKRECLTIETGTDAIRAGLGGVSGFAAPLSGEYDGPGGSIHFKPRYVRDMAATFGGRVSINWHDEKGATLWTSIDAPELIGVLMPMRSDGALPVPVAVDVTGSSYVAPAGQAADLFSVQKGIEMVDNRPGAGPRKASREEFESYARDYAKRARIAVDGLVMGKSFFTGPNYEVTFGDVLEQARVNVIERLNWETLTSEAIKVDVPAQYEAGAVSILLPGYWIRNAVATVSIDDGEPVAISADAKGSTAAALTAIMGPDVKERAGKVKRRALSVESAPAADIVATGEQWLGETWESALRQHHAGSLGTFECVDGTVSMVTRTRSKLYRTRIPARWQALAKELFDEQATIYAAKLASEADLSPAEHVAPVEAATMPETVAPMPSEAEIVPDAPAIIESDMQPDVIAALVARIEALEARVTPNEAIADTLSAECHAAPLPAYPGAKAMLASRDAVAAVRASRDRARRVRMLSAYMRMRGERERLRFDLWTSRDDAATALGDLARAHDCVRQEKRRTEIAESRFSELSKRAFLLRAKRARAVTLARARGERIAMQHRVIQNAINETKARDAQIAALKARPVHPDNANRPDDVARLWNERDEARTMLATVSNRLAILQRDSGARVDQMATELESMAGRALRAETALRAIKARQGGLRPYAVAAPVVAFSRAA